MASGKQSPGKSSGTGASAEKSPSRSRTVRAGHLAVSELASDRAGGPSPFGDDLVFPLPVEELRYTHTTP